jgi:hypothetical protein
MSITANTIVAELKLLSSGDLEDAMALAMARSIAGKTGQLAELDTGGGIIISKAAKESLGADARKAVDDAVLARMQKPPAKPTAKTAGKRGRHVMSVTGAQSLGDITVFGMPQGLMDKLEDFHTSADDAEILVAVYLRHLGIVRPTETTKGWAVALLLWSTIKRKNAFPRYEDIYSGVQNFVSLLESVRGDFPETMTEYPECAKDLPAAIYKQAFGDDDPPIEFNIPRVAQLFMRHVPLRESNHLIVQERKHEAAIGRHGDTRALANKRSPSLSRRRSSPRIRSVSPSRSGGKLQRYKYHRQDSRGSSSYDRDRRSRSPPSRHCAVRDRSRSRETRPRASHGRDSPSSRNRRRDSRSQSRLAETHIELTPRRRNLAIRDGPAPTPSSDVAATVAAVAASTAVTESLTPAAEAKATLTAEAVEADALKKLIARDKGKKEAKAARALKKRCRGHEKASRLQCRWIY